MRIFGIIIIFRKEKNDVRGQLLRKMLTVKIFYGRYAIRNYDMLWLTLMKYHKVFLEMLPSNISDWRWPLELCHGTTGCQLRAVSKYNLWAISPVWSELSSWPGSFTTPGDSASGVSKVPSESELRKEREETTLTTPQKRKCRYSLQPTDPKWHTYCMYAGKNRDNSHQLSNIYLPFS